MNSVRHPAGRSRFYLAALFLFWVAVYIPGLFRPALLDDADSVHAEAAREMLLRHDWVTLHIDGIRYLEKAPLLYWSVALSFRLFGVAEWTARLPLALGILALLYSSFSAGACSVKPAASTQLCPPGFPSARSFSRVASSRICFAWGKSKCRRWILL